MLFGRGERQRAEAREARAVRENREAKTASGLVTDPWDTPGANSLSQGPSHVAQVTRGLLS